MTNSLAPLSEPYAPDIAKILAQYPHQDGYLLALFRTFANSTRFLERGVPNLLDEDSPLPLRVREIVILRVTANNNCEYEWGIHLVIFSKSAKLSEDDVNATCRSTVDANDWNAAEVNLLHAIDQLCADGSVSGDVLEQFQHHWTAEQQLEIFALCGAYHTVSFVANSANLPNEAFAARFPR